jgi:hypothetical protein
MVANPTSKAKAREKRTLTTKQERFVKEYARYGNGTGAAKAAGYKGSDAVLCTIAWENMRKPDIALAVERESDRIADQEDYSALRVRRRLDRLSHGAEGAEQYGVAVRAEELIGKAAGMFVDQSIVMRGDLSADHLSALVEIARKRQEQPLDLGKPQGKARLLNE